MNQAPVSLVLTVIGEWGHDAILTTTISIYMR